MQHALFFMLFLSTDEAGYVLFLFHKDDILDSISVALGARKIQEIFYLKAEVKSNKWSLIHILKTHPSSFFFFLSLKRIYSN